MKLQAPILITIPTPCTQSWEEMQPVQGGRHCEHCEKTVIDFTKMTDAQVLQFFKTNKSTTCGRFVSNQLDRTIKEVLVPKSNWWARIAAGILLAFGLTKSAEGQVKKGKAKHQTVQASTPQKEVVIFSPKPDSSDFKYYVNNEKVHILKEPTYFLGGAIGVSTTIIKVYHDENTMHPPGQKTRYSEQIEHTPGR